MFILIIKINVSKKLNLELLILKNVNFKGSFKKFRETQVLELHNS
jgi:hypothetical protein